MVRFSALSSGPKGGKGVVCSKGIPVLGWFMVSGEEGFRKSIVLRLERATEIEKSPTTGMRRSMTSSAAEVAPPAPSVGLNLKTKRLIRSHEFPRRKSPKKGRMMREFTILAHGTDTHCPCGRSR